MESSENHLRPKCKIKRANIPQLQQGIQKSEAFRFHGFDQGNNNVYFKMGSNLKLKEDGTFSELRTNMLADLSKKLKIKETITKHQRQRSLHNRRRQIRSEQQKGKKLAWNTQKDLMQGAGGRLHDQQPAFGS